MTNNLIKGVLEDNRTQLHSRKNVIATGIGYKVTKGRQVSTLGIICSVEKKVSADQLSSQDLIPKLIDGISTDVVQTGRIQALASRTDRIRPAPGGVSIGHEDITAGTLGCLVRKDGQAFILSNNHVLANSNDAEIGDAILQPGPIDGGRLGSHIATLAQFVPIAFDGEPSDCPLAKETTDLLNAVAKLVGSNVRLQAISDQVPENLVDAAIAHPMNPVDVIPEILEIGFVQGIVEGVLGMEVKKSGRTTGLTTGRILQVDVSVNVQYGKNQIAYFVDQILTSSMSQGGDSGSVVLDNENNLVGLLFAGSNAVTILNRIENVFSALDISFI